MMNWDDFNTPARLSSQTSRVHWGCRGRACSAWSCSPSASPRQPSACPAPPLSPSKELVDGKMWICTDRLAFHSEQTAKAWQRTDPEGDKWKSDEDENLTSRRRISVADATFTKCLVLLLDLHNLFALDKKTTSSTCSNNSISYWLGHIILSGLTEIWLAAYSLNAYVWNVNQLSMIQDLGIDQSFGKLI